MKKIKKDIAQKDNNSGDLATKIDDYKYVLDTINSWIASADNKVSIYCGMYSVVIAAITFAANRLLSELHVSSDVVNQCAHNIFTVCVVVAIATFLVSTVFYTLSVKPKLLGEKYGKKGKKKEYSLFYANISKFRDSDEFVSAVKNSNRKDYYQELLKEVYYNSVVCTKKMKCFQIAVVSSALSVIMTVGACIAYYYSYSGSL